MTLLALAGLFVSLYMLLYSLGVYGSLMCGPGGSCEVVQASSWAVFLGIPVPGWGVAWYAAVFALALAGLRRDERSSGAGREAREPGTDRTEVALRLLAAAGLAFTLYLTAVEAFVLHAFCRWCLASAVLATGIAAVVGYGWCRERRG